MRDTVILQCGECKRRNYTTTRNKRIHQDKYVIKKFCPHCKKHTEHKESK